MLYICICSNKFDLTQTIRVSHIVLGCNGGHGHRPELFLVHNCGHRKDQSLRQRIKLFLSILVIINTKDTTIPSS
jgi:hypothetical protein